MLIRCLATLTEPADTKIWPQAPGGDFDEHLSHSVSTQEAPPCYFGSAIYILLVMRVKEWCLGSDPLGTTRR